jgi:ribosome-associated protein
LTSKERALDIAHRLSAMKASEILVFDLREVSSFTDYFVIASGTSRRHVKSLAGETTQAVREQGEQTLGVEGDPPGRWMLVDAGDVVVHLFEPEARAFYALERLWSEAEQLDLPSEPGSGVAEAAR